MDFFLSFFFLIHFFSLEQRSLISDLQLPSNVCFTAGSLGLYLPSHPTASLAHHALSLREHRGRGPVNFQPEWESNTGRMERNGNEPYSQFCATAYP